MSSAEEKEKEWEIIFNILRDSTKVYGKICTPEKLPEDVQKLYDKCLNNNINFEDLKKTMEQENIRTDSIEGFINNSMVKVLSHSTFELHTLKNFKTFVECLNKLLERLNTQSSTQNTSGTTRSIKGDLTENLSEENYLNLLENLYKKFGSCDGNYRNLIEKELEGNSENKKSFISFINETELLTEFRNSKLSTTNPGDKQIIDKFINCLKQFSTAEEPQK